MARGELKQRVVDQIQRDPYRSSADIAKAAGVRIDYVRHVAHQEKLSVGERKGERTRKVVLSHENLMWLELQAAEHNVALPELINACVTDHRLDDESE
ncbi:hypothetical protein KMP13_02270 [Epibacterium ulvae]|uniref:hypothetical protein n=1 Tax=Epibacterium ulvae TaxID=1156985 RepID=UPI001BFCB816|nr:hypothetical protein [Epibacterium ulvae]MBT8152739.1 hypothetical protein [Epibacterium ulvae]